MKTFGNKLDEIIERKRQEVERLRPRLDELRFAAQAREDFRCFHTALGGALRDQAEGEGYGAEELALIAEVKRASPSAGVITADFDPVAVARAYEAAGADAISVLTDEPFFQGHLSHLSRIREEVDLPLLRKDFIVDEVQIYESVAAGADAVLLIVGALEQEALVHLLEVARRCRLDALVEVHDLAETERALATEASIIGVNNRDLRTFEVDLATTERLSEEVGPDCILVSESGIETGAHADGIRSWGGDAVLVGEALMRAEDRAAMVSSLKGRGAT